MNKDCSICVYNKVCTSARRNNAAYTDCCIPEAPLRAIQSKYKQFVDLWIAKTNEYIGQCKNKSTYWTTQAYAEFNR